MKSPLLGLLLLGVLSVAVSELSYHDEHHPHKEDIHHVEERLAKLNAKVQNLVEDLHDRTGGIKMKKALHAEFRLNRLEDQHRDMPCDNRTEFDCLGHDPQCVSHLMVCDGVSDCRNGNDEAHCEQPFHEGDVYEGHVIFDKCTQRRPKKMTLTIRAVHTPVFFTAFSKVDTTIGIAQDVRLFSGEVSLPSTGYYSFGRRALVVVPPEKDRLGLVCYFDGVDYDRCLAKVVHEATLDICAMFFFVRQHDHH